MTPLFNPYGYKSVKIIYDSDDATALPGPIKLALIQWVSRMLDNAPDSGKDTVREDVETIRTHFKEDKFGEMPDSRKQSKSLIIR